MIASVDCSGASWNSSDSATPIRSGVEQPHDLGPVLQIGAGGVAEAVPAAPVAHAQDARRDRQGRRPRCPEPADPRVPVLGERLGQLHRQPVQLQVVAVRVLGEQLPGRLADRRPDRHQLERDHVGLAEDRGRKKSARHSRRSRRWRGKVNRSRSSAVLVQHDQVVALADAREVPVHDGGLQQSLGLRPLQPHPQPRPALGLDQFLVRRPAAAAGRLEPPLAQEQGALVQIAGVVGERDALDYPGAEERRCWHGYIDGYVGTNACHGCRPAPAPRRTGHVGLCPGAAGRTRRSRSAGRLAPARRA